MTSNVNDTFPQTEKKQQKSLNKADPTSRWSERVRAMSSKQPHRVNYLRHKDTYEDKDPSLKEDLQRLVKTTQACIVKRPLTSMVIAVTAGATVTALLSALISNKKGS